MWHNSGDLYRELVRQGLGTKAAGTAIRPRMKVRRGAQNTAQPRQVAGAREEYAGVRLVWSQSTTMSKRTSKAPLLMLVVSK